MTETGDVVKSPYRDKTETLDLPCTIRFKVPEGSTTITDHVQGEITWDNATLDDLVLLRADGTPTYMLAVVVDDHNMGITHVIRGDDHLINAARQSQIYAAMGWDIPEWAHVPSLRFSHWTASTAPLRDSTLIRWTLSTANILTPQTGHIF